MAIVFRIQQPNQCSSRVFRHPHFFPIWIDVMKCSAFCFVCTIECVWVFATMLRFYSKLTPTSTSDTKLWNFVASEICARQPHVCCVCVCSSSSSSTPWICKYQNALCYKFIFIPWFCLASKRFMNLANDSWSFCVRSRSRLYTVFCFFFFLHMPNSDLYRVHWVIHTYVRTLNRIFRNRDVEICFANVLICR